jgi:radical SAM superfamily enzyme YgiQ (UPF0313 family)
MGIREFFFFDDTFAIDKLRVLDICSGILERNLKIKWAIRTRVDNVDREILERLKEAGCFRIQYGVEAGTQEILDVLRKGVTIQQVERTFSLTKSVGISTYADFMIGSPGETKRHIQETISFAKRINPDFVEFTITTPYPRTDLFRLGVEKGIIDAEHWRKFAQNPDGGFTPSFWEEKFSGEELLGLLHYAYKNFYLRWPYILRRLSKVNSITELARQTKAGIKVLRL